MNYGSQTKVFLDADGLRFDFFEAIYYGSKMGHFTSPDPGGLLTQNQEYPQSWN